MKKLLTLIVIFMLGSMGISQAQQKSQPKKAPTQKTQAAPAQNSNKPAAAATTAATTTTTTSTTAPAKKDGPKMTFAEDLHDFGKINEGVIAEYEFKFTNTGNQPLLITNVRPSCGCTTPSYTKEPIAPGKSGVIKVSYNSVNRPGTFTKSITVTTNVEGDAQVLFIKGEVIPSPNLQVDPNQSPVRLNNG